VGRRRPATALAAAIVAAPRSWSSSTSSRATGRAWADLDANPAHWPTCSPASADPRRGWPTCPGRAARAGGTRCRPILGQRPKPIGSFPDFERAVERVVYPALTAAVTGHYSPPALSRDELDYCAAAARHYGLGWYPTFTCRGSSPADMADRVAQATARGARAGVIWPDVARRQDAGGRPLLDYLGARAAGAARTADAAITDLCAALRVARGEI
jgi:hypothetical protein